MRPAATTVVPYFLEVEPPAIAMVKFLFESYEDIGIVRTLDRHRAVIVLLAAPDFVDDVEAILAELVASGGARRVAAPPEADGDWLMRAMQSDE